MFWLLIAILSYFFFSLSSLGDRYLLVGPPKAKTYAFYVSFLGILSLILVPFVNFSLPEINVIIFSFFTGLIFFLSLLFLYYGLERFEVSRIVPALGGFMPIFTFVLAFFMIGEEGFFSSWQNLLPFCLLILGSIIISLEKSAKFSFKALTVAALAGFFLSLYFVMSKLVYFDVSFWTGFILIRIGAFLASLFLFFSKEVRGEVFSLKKSFTQKTGLIFFLVQASGALAVILQNWSIALVNSLYLSFISAVQGIQYVFLFILTILFSLKSPDILKENLSAKTVLQKIFAIALIIIGLVLLAF
jgi:drug/metabolite transporter (DMT)-like permease